MGTPIYPIEGIALDSTGDLVANSLADYVMRAQSGVAEIEAHNHNWERWFGAAAVPNAEIHVADRLGVGVVRFRIDAGNNDWGAWVQILGSADTPSADVPTYTRYDFHRVQIVAAERDDAYFVQFAFGASGAAGLAAGSYSEVVYKPVTGLFPEVPVIVQTRRQAVGTKAWARCLCPLQDTGTLDFFIGLHQYLT